MELSQNPGGATTIASEAPAMQSRSMYAENASHGNACEACAYRQNALVATVSTAKMARLNTIRPAWEEPLTEARHSSRKMSRLGHATTAKGDARIDQIFYIDNRV